MSEPFASLPELDIATGRVPGRGLCRLERAQLAVDGIVPGCVPGWLVDRFRGSDRAKPLR